MRIEGLRDLEEYLSKTKFPGKDLLLRIRKQFGDINLPESARRIACCGGLGEKKERQKFYGKVVSGQGTDTHFSGKERSVLKESERRFDHHSR